MNIYFSGRLLTATDLGAEQEASVHPGAGAAASAASSDLRAGTPGETLSLWQVTSDLSQRLIKLFLRDETTGRRPANGRCEKFNTDPHWKDLILFYEYFDGDTGAGLGASHQTGWTGLVAKLIQQHGEYTLQHKAHQAVEEQQFMQRADSP